jgi:hypothetical protein
MSAVKKAAKKTTPRSKSPGGVGRPNTKYEYVELGKVSVASTDVVHFYGVIIDATFPFKKSADMFECYLKVIDPTLKPTKGGQGWAQVALRARRFEDLPICHRIGDLIRVHRANLQLYKGTRVFQVNVAYKSSWSLFSCDKASPLGVSAGDAPYAFSGRRATQEK